MNTIMPAIYLRGGGRLVPIMQFKRHRNRDRFLDFIGTLPEDQKQRKFNEWLKYEQQP